jgi:hypothetical protein
MDKCKWDESWVGKDEKDLVCNEHSSLHCEKARLERLIRLKDELADGKTHFGYVQKQMLENIDIQIAEKKKALGIK